jgi:HK97 family phage prohead protease
MAFRKTFLISDESVNTYGFAVATSGIRLDNAKQNCPCYYEHNNDELPLGHWENFRLEGVKLYADLVIEGASEVEQEYIRKIKNGDIKGASIGADPIKWDEFKTKLDGQTKPWLTECDLFEVSITALPANKKALALKKDGAVVKLNSTNTVLFIPTTTTKIENDMKAIALKLGLPETATEAEILSAIGTVQLKASNAEQLQNTILQEAEVGLTDEQKEMFVELKKTNPAVALKYANSVKANDTTEEGTVNPNGSKKPVANTKVVKDVKVSALLKKGLKPGGENDEEEFTGKNSFDYLQRKNPTELARIRKEEPEKYARLTADYGKGLRYTDK